MKPTYYKVGGQWVLVSALHDQKPGTIAGYPFVVVDPHPSCRCVPFTITKD
jgi:hypothetical protein